MKTRTPRPQTLIEPTPSFPPATAFNIHPSRANWSLESPEVRKVYHRMRSDSPEVLRALGSLLDVVQSNSRKPADNYTGFLNMMCSITTSALFFTLDDQAALAAVAREMCERRMREAQLAKLAPKRTHTLQLVTAQEA